MSHWSEAQSFWQWHKVSQQVTAGCLSAREGVTSHRETTSLICHFRSISQRKRRREGATDRERECALKYCGSVIQTDETMAGQTERCWPCGWATVSLLCLCVCFFVASDKYFMNYLKNEV